MKYVVEKEEKRDVTFTIDIPSYWKAGSSYYRVFKRNDEILCDIISDWNVLNQLEISTNRSITAARFDKQITKEEWMGAVDLVIDKLDIIINEEEPQGEDSFYHLSKTLLPTHPEKE